MSDHDDIKQRLISGNVPPQWRTFPFQKTSLITNTLLNLVLLGAAVFIFFLLAQSYSVSAALAAWSDASFVFLFLGFGILAALYASVRGINKIIRSKENYLVFTDDALVELSYGRTKSYAYRAIRDVAITQTNSGMKLDPGWSHIYLTFTVEAKRIELNKDRAYTKSLRDIGDLLAKKAGESLKVNIQ